MFTIGSEREFEEAVEVLHALKKHMFGDNKSNEANKAARAANNLIRAMIIYAEEIGMDDYTFVCIVRGIFE